MTLEKVTAALEAMAEVLKGIAETLNGMAEAQTLSLQRSKIACSTLVLDALYHHHVVVN